MKYFFSNFKNLPISTQRLLGFGLIMSLVVALPLFIWGVTTQNFNPNKKAQITTGIGQKSVKVMVIDFDPILTSHGNQKLSTYENWSIPEDLEASYSSTVKQLSGNYANYQIVDRVDVNAFPRLNDGFTYTESSYLSCLANNQNCHNPWLVDYLKILSDYQVCDKLNSGEIDELWLWGGPWFGYWEATMAGPKAFSTNSPPIAGSTCNKDLNIMGFSYERGLSEMLEDLGHRFEGTMTYVFTNNNIDFWTKYTAHSACGSVHIPPNGTTDYDWQNTPQVSSNCEDYFNYPTLTTQTQTFGCERWGCTGLGWKKYWLNHIPKAASVTNGTWDNWWKYVFDYSDAIAATPTPTPTFTPTPSPTTPPNTYDNPNSCNGTCGSNYNCQSGYFCFNGYCRNPNCRDNSTCDCTNSTPTPTPVAALHVKQIQPISKIVYYSPTPASYSGILESFINSPKPTSIPAQTTANKIDIKYILVGLFAVIALGFGLFALFSSITARNKVPEITPYTPTAEPQNPPTDSPPPNIPQNSI